MAELIVNPYTHEPYVNRNTGKPHTYTGIPEKYFGKVESPREAMLIRAIAKYRPHWINRLEMQHKIQVGNKTYRLDFAFVDVRLDVEIDGEHHLTDEIKGKDDARDTALEALGWKVLRMQTRHVYSKGMRDRVLARLDKIIQMIESGSDGPIPKYFDRTHKEQVTGEWQRKQEYRKVVKALRKQNSRYLIDDNELESAVLFSSVLTPYKRFNPVSLLTVSSSLFSAGEDVTIACPRYRPTRKERI